MEKRHKQEFDFTLLLNDKVICIRNFRIKDFNLNCKKIARNKRNDFRVNSNYSESIYI